MAPQSEINDSTVPAGGRRSRGNVRKHNGDTPAWTLKKAVELIAYLVMLILVLIYFTGKGLFIYEGF